MNKIEIKHLENKDIDIVVEGKSYAKLLRKADISEGYDIILDFEPNEDFIATAGSLMYATYIVKNQIESCFDLTLSF